MTTLELKTKIHKAIDNVPENALPELFTYINSIQHQPPSKEQLKAFVAKVFKEDDELLRKLGQ
jgi:hypothetical protein